MQLSEKFKSRFEAFAKPIRELLGRLTPSQRASLAALALVMVVALGLLTFTGGSQEGRGTIELPYSEEKVQMLERANIRYERTDTGKLAILAADEASFLSHMLENGLDEAGVDYFKFLDDEPRLGETAGTRQARLQNARIKTLQGALSLLSGVRRAIVQVNTPMESLYVSTGRRSSAMVNIVTDGQRLKPRLARSIARGTATAFGIEPDAVTVMDQFGDVNTSGTDFPDTEHLEEESRYTERAKHHLDQLYGPGNYVVTVDIEYDRTTTRGVEERFTEPVSGKAETISERNVTQQQPAAIGVEGNVARATAKDSDGGLLSTLERDETRNELRFGTETTERSTPPGTKTHATFMVSVAIDAVKRQVRSKKDLANDKSEVTAADINSHTDELKSKLRGITAMSPEQVFVECFTYSPEVNTVSETESAGLLTAVNFMGGHARELLLGLLALVGCLVLYKAATARGPELESLPDPVVDLQRFLDERAEADRQRELAAKTSEGPEAIDWEVSDQDRQDIELLNSVAEFARERPEVAATVLRNWIAEAPKSVLPAEGAAAALASSLNGAEAHPPETEPNKS